MVKTLSDLAKLLDILRERRVSRIKWGALELTLEGAPAAPGMTPDVATTSEVDEWRRFFEAEADKQDPSADKATGPLSDPDLYQGGQVPSLPRYEQD